MVHGQSLKDPPGGPALEFAGQEEQDPAPAAAYWPVEQGVHEELVPGCEPLPIVEYEPVPHVPHSVVWPALL